MAAQFQVSITPTIIIIQRGGTNYMPVSAGVASVAEIEDGTYRAIRALKGETSPENFDMYEFQRGGGFDPSARHQQK